MKSPPQHFPKIDFNPNAFLTECRYTTYNTKHLPWITQRFQARKELIKARAEEIQTVTDRCFIRDEIYAALDGDIPGNFFRSMLECGILGYIFPDLMLSVGLDGGIYHGETVFEHLTNSLDASVKHTNKKLLKLAVLCHDIAKPHTLSIDKDRNYHFHKHEVVGAKIAYNWMQSLYFPENECRYVSKMVRYHQFRFEDNTKNSTILHWLQAVGPDWYDLITLRICDREGNTTKKGKPVFTKEMHKLIERVTYLIQEGKPIFFTDLPFSVQPSSLRRLGIPSNLQKTVLSQLIEFIRADLKHYNDHDLLGYIDRNFLCKGKHNVQNTIRSV